MWESTFGKAIRWIIYLPLVLLFLTILEWFGMRVTAWLYGLDRFWLIFLFLFCGGYLFVGGAGLAIGTSALVTRVCPDKKMGSMILAIFGIIIGLLELISLWTRDGLTDGIRIMGTMIFAALFGGLIWASFVFAEEPKN